MSNRFAALKVLRQELDDTVPEDADLENALELPPPSVKAVSTNEETILKRPVGRPPGRRSDPDYTQISAYIPLDLLQEVQDALSQERRILKKRTPRPVSDLIEQLLSEWLKEQKKAKI
jgi:hypothetical protein